MKPPLRQKSKKMPQLQFQNKSRHRMSILMFITPRQVRKTSTKPQSKIKKKRKTKMRWFLSWNSGDSQNKRIISISYWGSSSQWSLGVASPFSHSSGGKYWTPSSSQLTLKQDLTRQPTIATSSSALESAPYSPPGYPSAPGPSWATGCPLHAEKLISKACSSKI